MWRKLVLACLAQAFCSTAYAGVIDFESGFANGQSVGSLVSGDLSLSASCGASFLGSQACVVAEQGTLPTAFVSPIRHNRGFDESRTGNASLTDAEGTGASNNFFFISDIGLNWFSIDLLDYRMDGGAKLGDVVSINAFDHFGGALLASFAFEIADGWEDGNIISASLASIEKFKFIEVVHSGKDVGTAVDNISFGADASSVSEPSTIALILGGIAFAIRRRNARA